MQDLRDYQKEALSRMKNGCILCGDTGSGKSFTALSYYFIQNGGSVKAECYDRMTRTQDLYIITTAMKRDRYEWEDEMRPFHLGSYDLKVTVDSWNNVKKYVGIKNAFFIFDEQRVIGYGTWALSFIKIARENNWILLSATPGDTWMDYIPVFIANGFYRNKTDFVHQHVVYNSYGNFRKVDRYINEGILIRRRDYILVKMDYKRPTVRHDEEIIVDYDVKKYREMLRYRWDNEKGRPFMNASDLCYALRKLVNADESRQLAVLEIVEAKKRAIIFYNFDYELEILRNLAYGPNVVIAEWNGHVHEEVPNTREWVYLVQYAAGSEGWNCVKTDTIIFFSQTYSYKVLKQASGRIDRMNTPFTDLYFYHLKSRSKIDLAIGRALAAKRSFNERIFIEGRRKL